MGGTDGQGRGAAARRLAVDVAVLGAIGLLLGFLGPFESEQAPALFRYSYWVICIVGGGLIGMGAEALLRRRVAAVWPRVLVTTAVATPVVALFVLTVEHLMTDQAIAGPGYLRLLWQVPPILLGVLAVKALLRRPPRVETRTVVAPPLPEAEAAFRRRLSARRRAARLIAVEAHDHYLKVHTDAGEEMITLRFADALDELSHAHGWRVHRSWWVAAEAVEGVRWRKGAGELRLACGLTAPVSRTHAPVLKQAGWF